MVPRHGSRLLPRTPHGCHEFARRHVCHQVQLREALALFRVEKACPILPVVAPTKPEHVQVERKDSGQGRRRSVGLWDAEQHPDTYRTARPPAKRRDRHAQNGRRSSTRCSRARPAVTSRNPEKEATPPEQGRRRHFTCGATVRVRSSVRKESPQPAKARSVGLSFGRSQVDIHRKLTGFRATSTSGLCPALPHVVDARRRVLSASKGG